MKNEIKILDNKQISQKILRLSWEIYENNFSENEIILVGIGDKGLSIAKSVNDNLINISHLKPIVSKITFDRNNPHDDIILDLNKKEYIKNNGHTYNSFENQNFLSIKEIQKLISENLSDFEN